MIRTVTFKNGTTAQIIDGDTHVGRWVVENDRLDHDQNMLPLLVPYLHGTVIDVGAFIGDHTAFYARHAERVFAFEPSPEAFSCLRENMRPHCDVWCIPAGLGAKDGTASIVTNDNAGMATLVDGEDITVFSLDSYTLTDVSFLKIDAEGWECDVLDGANKTIEGNRPVMLIEVNAFALAARGRTPEELATKITGLGYSMRNVYEGQSMHGDQYDVLCFPLTTKKEHTDEEPL